ncbi:cadherin domain-containing protein [Stappia sp.]|uniref:cadherin domain-containing protein n=1 Tax=Stappia sp. TaxID=1870903 RepID=UPI0032D91FC6
MSDDTTTNTPTPPATGPRSAVTSSANEAAAAKTRVDADRKALREAHEYDHDPHDPVSNENTLSNLHLGAIAGAALMAGLDDDGAAEARPADTGSAPRSDGSGATAPLPEGRGTRQPDPAQDGGLPTQAQALGSSSSAGSAAGSGMSPLDSPRVSSNAAASSFGTPDAADVERTVSDSGGTAPAPAPATNGSRFLDLHDVTPVTDTDGSANTLAEDASAGSTVGIVASATDADVTDTVSYSVDDPRFTVDPDGTIRVADGASFDAETEGSISLTVTATSTDGSTSSETFTINVTDVDEADVGPVTDIDGSANTLAEDASAGTTIGLVASATDADVTDTVSYSVDDPRFTVDPDGTVRVADGAGFDAETEGSISLTVTATSTDGSTSQETFAVNVTDVDEADVGPVTDTDAAANTLAEDASAGTAIGLVASATDADITDTVSYSVDDARFTVDPDGTVRVADGASFDAETEGSISLTVTATSTDGSTASETFTVQVTDVDEVDVGPVTDTDGSANTLAEDASAGSTVGIVASATDADVTDTVSYSVDDPRFTVDPDGTIRVADGANFDAETEGSIALTVTATSTDGSTSSETFTVAVADVDEADVGPVTDTDGSANTLAEDASAGSTVGIVASATDADITDTVSYSVDNARFTVDPDGTVRVADGASFDAETEGSIALTVTATSTDGSTSSETFTVAITDVDEADVGPVTDIDGSANTLAEDASAGSTVGIVANATDADVTDTVSYSVDDARFTVDPDGTIRIADGASFDAETEGSIALTVTATSTDGSTSSETFTVAITDVDEADVGPVTDTDAAANTLAEDASAGSTVGIMASATDADITDTVSYSVDDPRFTIDPDGTVRVAPGASFDAETEGSISLTVTATSTDGSTSQEIFAVNVTDVDEADVGPVTDTDAAANTLAEDANAGTAIGLVASATDADVTDTVSYSVDDPRFTVDPDGTIRVADGASFDAETEGSISLTVTATSTDGSTASETFTVQVSDVDEVDVGPVTDTDGSANTLAEDASAGSTVGIVASATDADVTDTVSYSVDDPRFIVDPDGTVRVAPGASFDAETEGSIALTVTATSTDGSTSSETFTVNVTDVDEADVGPVTDTDAAANTLAEDASAGTTIGLVASATDADVTDTVSYSVDDARFTVDPDGTIRVADGASFDAETEDSISLTVTATSTDGSTSSETFTVNVTDVDEADVGPVTDTDGSANTLAEDASAGTTIGLMASATDADVTDTVSYSVDDARFTVDPDGTIRVADGASFDAETEGAINLTVTATSTDGSTSSETFTVQVSDVDEADVGPVTDTDAAANTLAEDASAGSTVGIVASATDADITDTVSYSVDDPRFTVDPDGTIRVADGASFDAETEGSIALTVTATSTDGSTSSETFTVAITDVDEADVGPVTDTDAAANTLAEDASAGSTVGIVASATDADVTDTVSYSVDDARFTVDPDGTIRVADGASFDAETEGSISLTVTATSTDGSTSSETFTINVTDVDEADVGPVTDIDGSANTLAEDASAGTTIGLVASATDADVTDTVSYSVDDARFTVDPDGTVRVADGAGFDAETEGSISLTVTATSTDGSTSQETFAVNVTDVDEADVGPVTDTDAAANTLAEDASAGTAIGLVASATDADITDTVSYSVDDARFTVDPDGTVRVADGASFDAETEGSISLTVTATSTDGSTASETFTVQVTDVDEVDVGPVTDTDGSANTLAEDASAGSTVGIVASATDADVTDTVSYSVDDPRFTVDPDGTIRVTDGASFDAETEGSISLTVTATSTDGSTSSETFTINVTDVDEADVGPVTDIDGSANTLAEDANAGTAFGLVASATDADITDTVSYSVDDARFTVDPDGTVRVADGASFDAETEGSINLTVTATSTDGSTSSETFTVAVTDVDEADVGPVTDTDGSANTLAEDASAGSTVGIVASATDADITDSVSYSVDDARFTVDPDGTIRIVDGASFDAETEGSISLTVTATSTDGSTSSETFTVQVSDVDEADVGPVTDTDGSANTLAEDASAGSTVGIVASATDADVTDTVSYSVDDPRFTVDPDGTIRVADGASFDAETEGSISLTVTATSTDGSTSQETFTVQVTDVDEADVGPVTDTDAAANTLAEDASAGSTVGIVASATDADVTDTVSYSVDDARFTVDPDGTVRVADGASFDAETEGSIALTVTATSTDGSTSSETFTVAVTDVDEADVGPVTDTDGSANTLAEDASAGSTVGIVASATDADVTDTVSYSVDDARFTVDPDGTVRVAPGASFDAETEGSISLTVTATSTDGSTSSETFTVQVSDVDEADVGPVTDIDGSANTLAEDASAGTAIGLVASATDADVTDTVSYAVDDARFTADPDGTIRVADGASFDAETEGSISLTVTATSTDGSTASETFTVQVSDVDEVDVGPVTDTDGSANTLAEDASAGSTVGIVASATDADVTDTVSYSVDDARFTVDPDGTIRVADGASFDAETEGSIALTVTATSTDGSTSSETFAINVANVIDETPTDIVMDGGAVDENSVAGTVVATLSAVDADAGDSHSYALTNDPSGFFEIVGNEIRVRAGAALDHETAAQHTVTVQVTDAAGNSHSEALTLAIRDVNEAPTDVTLSASQVAENDAGAIVGALSTTDPDAGDSHSYTVSDTRFEVVNGQLKLKDGVSLDHESTPTVDVTVTATDSGGLTTDQVVTVQVTDVNEGPNAGLVDLGAVAEDGSLTFTAAQLLANSSDVDGDALTVSNVAVDPAYGTLADNGDGTWTFTPANDYAANDVPVSFTVTDGQYSSNSWALVDVTPVADTPTVAVADNQVLVFSSTFESTSGFVTTIDGWQSDNFIEVRSGIEASSGPDSQNHIELNTDPGSSGDWQDAPNIYRTVDTNAEGTYELTFDYAARPGFDDTVCRVEILWDGQVVATVSADGSNDSVPVWQSYTIELPGNGDPTRLEFREVGVDQAGGRGLFLDNIEMTEFTAGSARGTAGSAIDLPDITTGLGDTDGSESIAVAVSGLVAGTILSDGTHSVTVASDGATVDVSDWNLTALQATPPESFNGMQSIVITATATEALNGDTTSTQVAIPMIVDPAHENLVTAPTDADATDNRIHETAVAGTAVGITALATDPDASDVVSYSVDDDRFTVDADGTVRVADHALFDHETEAYIDLGVMAHSTDGSSAMTSFRVYVQGNYGAYSAGNADGNTISVSGQSYEVKGFGGSDNIVTGAFNDRLDGGDGNDTLTAGAGNDLLFGGEGADMLYGGTGDDRLWGGAGNDALYGGDGDDVISGEGGTDTIDAGAGNDVIHYQVVYADGGDTVDGGDGTDLVDFSTSAPGGWTNGYGIGVDLASGAVTDIGSYDANGGYDFNYGTKGSLSNVEDLRGSTFNDVLKGDAGGNTLYGNAGDDFLSGRAGNDVLVGGEGNDALYGGDGADLFIYAAGDGSDTVAGGAGGGWVDVLDLGGGDPSALGDYGTDWTVTITEGSIVTDDSANGTLTLSDDASGYVDLQDGSRIDFSEIEQVQW